MLIDQQGSSPHASIIKGLSILQSRLDYPILPVGTWPDLHPPRVEEYSPHGRLQLAIREFIEGHDLAVVRRPDKVVQGSTVRRDHHHGLVEDRGVALPGPLRQRHVAEDPKLSIINSEELSRPHLQEFRSAEAVCVAQHQQVVGRAQMAQHGGQQLRLVYHNTGTRRSLVPTYKHTHTVFITRSPQRYSMSTSRIAHLLR